MSDFITRISPGLLVNTGKKYNFAAQYIAGINIFLDNSKENFTSHFASGDINLNFPAGFTLNVSDKYFKTKDPRDRADNPLRASHWTNDINSSIGYIFPGKKFSVEISYSNNHFEYDQEVNKEFNNSSDIISTNLYYKFLSKTSALLEYEYGMIDYFDSSDESTDKDSKINAINLGLRWDATAKLSGILKVGYKSVKFDNTFTKYNTSENESKYKDKKFIPVTGILSYRLSDDITIKPELIRSIKRTEYGGNKIFSASSYYLRTGGSIGLLYRPKKKIDILSGIGYFIHEYDAIESGKRERDDSVISFDLGIKYKIRKWLYTGINYDFYKVNSNDNVRDQTNNRFTVKVGVVF